MVQCNMDTSALYPGESTGTHLYENQVLSSRICTVRTPYMYSADLLFCNVCSCRYISGMQFQRTPGGRSLSSAEVCMRTSATMILRVGPFPDRLK